MRALPLLNQLAEYPVVRKDHSLQRDRNWWQIPCKRREVRMQVWPSGKRSVLNWLRGHFKSQPAVSQTAGIYRLGRGVVRETVELSRGGRVWKTEPGRWPPERNLSLTRFSVFFDESPRLR